MADPANIVWQALCRAKTRTGRNLELAERAGFGWPAIPEFQIREEFPAEEYRSPVALTGWVTMSGALVALRKLQEAGQ